MNEVLVTRMQMLEATEDRVPRLAVSDNLSSWFSLAIKRHTDGEYNHAFWAWAPGRVISQNWMLSDGPLDDYLEGKHRVKLMWNSVWTEEQIVRIRARLNGQLHRPWWKRMYDWPGILGQAMRLRGLNLPHRQYCSEAAGEVLRAVETAFGMKHPTPADLNKWCKRQDGWQALVYDPAVCL